MRNDFNAVILTIVAMIFAMQVYLSHGTVTFLIKPNGSRDDVIKGTQKLNKQTFHLQTESKILKRDHLHSISQRALALVYREFHKRGLPWIPSTKVNQALKTEADGIKSTSGNSVIGSPSRMNDTLPRYVDLHFDRVKRAVHTDASSSSNSLPLGNKENSGINIKELFVRKRDFLNTDNRKELTTITKLSPSNHVEAYTFSTLRMNTDPEMTMSSSEMDECFNFVSCIQPYISYVAGTIMFFLVLYLIMVFGRCVCDDSF